MQVRYASIPWLPFTFGLALALAGCGEPNISGLVETKAATAKLAIGGSATVHAGGSATFSATTPEGGTAAVRWSVNGEEGGDTRIGTIDATGNYSAPANTAPGVVAIAATETVSPFASGEKTLTLLNPVPVIDAVVVTSSSADFVELSVTAERLMPGAVAVLRDGITGGKQTSPDTIALVVPTSAITSEIGRIAVRNPEPGQNESQDYYISLPRSSRTARTTTALPSLPAVAYDYVAYAVTNLPAQYTSGNGNPSAADNTPGANAITSAGATLGRVLFYDKLLSANNTVACASCHQQANGFSDPASLSTGFQGGLTGRKTMGLSNAKYYQRGHFFWDERANTLEDQVLQPIQNQVEMGMTLPALVTKLSATSYYPQLFQAAFGTPVVTSDRISLALSQFVRSMVSYQSKFDSAFTAGTNGNPNFSVVFTASEVRGQQLFGANGCPACHGTNAHISATIQNNGLDAVTTDAGAGNGQFKAPSLRNIALRGSYMHDGRFTSLAQVVEFYNSGVQNNPNLSPLLRAPGGAVRRLNLSAQDKTDLVNFLNTLTDQAFLTDPKFASPF